MATVSAAPTEPLILLDPHLVPFTSTFDYLADTGVLDLEVLLRVFRVALVE